MPENGIKTFCPASREQWRAWLQEQHDKEKSVWLIFYKNKSNVPTITWSDAVDEAICFGWIDSIVKPVDDEKFMRLFSRRKVKSVWSAINKAKVQKLLDEKLITPAGLESINTAKQNGSWTILDNSEALIIPDDMEKELKKWPNAKNNFITWSKTDKKNVLQWIVLAKRPDTRQKRIKEIVELADQNLKPSVIRWKKARD